MRARQFAAPRGEPAIGFADDWRPDGRESDYFPPLGKAIMTLLDEPALDTMPDAQARCGESSIVGVTAMAEVEPPGPASVPSPRPLTARLLSESRLRLLWTLSDQAVVSIGNFLTGNQLARHLSPDHYGAFGAMLETLLFFNSLQAAVIIYPMTMKRAHGASRPQQIVTVSLLFTLALLPLLGTGMAAASYWAAQSNEHSIFAGSGQLPLLIGATVAAMVLWQGQELTRRALMADLRFAAAIPGDAVSYLGEFVWVYALAHTGLHNPGGSNLTLPAAMISIAATSAIAMVIQAFQTGMAPVRLTDLRQMGADFWHMGRWNLGASLTTLITSLGYIWTLKKIGGNTAVAAYVAVYLPLKLGNPLMSSAASLITPAVARASRDGSRAVRRVVLKYGGAIAAIAMPYVAVILLMPTLVLTVLFGRNSPYPQFGSFLRIAVIAYSMLYVSTVISAALNGLGRARANFLAQFGYVLVTLGLGLPLTIRFQLSGVMWGSFAAILTTLMLGGYALVQATGADATKPATLATSGTHNPAPTGRAAA
jgi:O-antigen/teichoic acid export membrane protein